MNEDESLWALYTQDVQRLKGRIDAAPAKDEKNKRPSSPKAPSSPSEFSRIEYVRGLPPAPLDATPAAPQLDRRTAEKLRKGQIPIEARIDLHGLYQEQARLALLQFVAESWARGLRCVLVVTGKGKLVFEDARHEAPARTPGVIKRNFKDWLAYEPYHSMILKIQKAQIKDGGEGAYYILLRRRRG